MKPLLQWMYWRHGSFHYFCPLTHVVGTSEQARGIQKLLKLCRRRHCNFSQLSLKYPWWCKTTIACLCKTTLSMKRPCWIQIRPLRTAWTKQPKWPHGLSTDIIQDVELGRLLPAPIQCEGWQSPTQILLATTGTTETIKHKVDKLNRLSTRTVIYYITKNCPFAKGLRP